jgi:hypothetical protein
MEWEGVPGTQPFYMSTYNKQPWSNNMAALIAGAVGTSSEKEFSVSEDGTYIFSASFIAHANGAIAKISIDGIDIGKEIDTYSDKPRDDYLLNSNEAMGPLKLGSVFLRAGAHKVKIVITGKNKKAKASELIIDCITINPDLEQKRD